MSLSNWGGQPIIDLTNDSDEDEELPNAVPRTLRPPSSVAPVPEAIDLTGATTTVRKTNPYASSPQIASSNPRDRTAGISTNEQGVLAIRGNAFSATEPAGFGLSRSGASTAYFPVHSHAYGTTNNLEIDQQVEKRRRLSSIEIQRAVPGNMQYGGRDLINGHGSNAGRPSVEDNNVVLYEETSSVLHPSQVPALRSQSNATSSLGGSEKASAYSHNSGLRQQGANRPIYDGIRSDRPHQAHINKIVNDGESSGTSGPSSAVPTTVPTNASNFDLAASRQPAYEVIDTDDEDPVTTHCLNAKKPAQESKTEIVQKSEPMDQIQSPSLDSAIIYSMEGTKQRRLVFSDPAHSSHDYASGSPDSVVSHVSTGSDSGEPRAAYESPLAEPPQLSTPSDTGEPKGLDESLLVQPLHNATPTTTQTDTRRRRQAHQRAGQFSEQEDHLLIFLKEVKKCKWKDIARIMSHRTYGTLQTHYSHTLNKRDRSKDPPVLSLPKHFAAEAKIDWAAVHKDHPRLEFTGQGVISSLSHQADQDEYNTPQAFTIRKEMQLDFPSDAESGSRLKRSRRAVPKVNYKWPLKGLEDAHDDDDEDDGYMAFSSTRNVDSFASSEEPSKELFKELAVVPDKAIPVDNQPLQIDFDDENAEIGLNASQSVSSISKIAMPYLSSVQRSRIRKPRSAWEWDQLVSRDWQGSVLHVDFSGEEMDVVERAIAKFLRSTEQSRYSSRRRRLRASLQELSEPKVLKLSNKIRCRLPSRSLESIRAFLQDALDGRLSSTQHIGRIGAARPEKTYSSEAKVTSSSLVRNRELGLQNNRGWKASSRSLTYQLKNNVWDTLGPAYWWTGASSDVHTVAWSLDGQCFAAGAVAVSDPHSMQYNKPNNLLYGNITDRTIHELGEHRDERPRTESGPNSTHAMYASQDPLLYKTVSSVVFSPSDRLLYSAGYDKNVCIWDVSTDKPQPELVGLMNAKADIDMLAINHDGLLAIAAKRSLNNSVKVVNIDEDNPSEFTWYNFHSQKAGQRPDQNILPTALKFDPSDGRALLAGFGANVRDDRLDTTGDICMWDIRTQTETPIHGSSKNVFDVAFNSNRRRMPWFAVGCVAGQNVNRGTRSLIRLYDGYGHAKYTMQMELECKALDMNDVVWCPYDEHLLAVGCTSGRAYVWDLRRPDQFLRELGHGRSLMPLEDGIDREITDTGIRFLSWGENATRLYSGSSDGIVKVWDVTRSEEQTFIKDLITVDSGVMAGAFSPDKSKLVLGDVHGSVNILEVGRDDCSTKSAERLKYIPYCELPDEEETPPIVDSGIAEAALLLQTNQMTIAPMGGLPIQQAVQGQEYSGPYDRSIDAPALRQQALDFQLSLATNSEPKCTLKSCKEGFVKITSEETGDSGRSKDRIPDELRQQWTASTSELEILQGKSRCMSCGRPARPSPSTIVSATAPVLCEHCSFACFRCGAINKIEPAHVLLTCTSCERNWDMGSLGYECTTQTGRVGKSLNVPPLIGYGKDCHNSRIQDETDTSFGDELNALTDYYHSLAVDRPKSPPL